jgi:cytochrome P450
VTTVESGRAFDTDLDHHSAEFREHNYELMDDLRSRCPVARTSSHDGFWIFSSYDAVFEAVQDFETFGNAMHKAVPTNQMTVPLIPIDVDPPKLQAYRSLLLPYLSPGAARKQEARLRALATELIDGFVEAGHADLSTQLFTPLPARWILELLGFDTERWPEWISWVHAAIHDRTADPERGIWGITSFYTTIAAEIATRRAQPSDGLLSDLMTAEVDGEKLTDEELIGMVFLLILGGMDTTAGLTGNSTLRLAADPALRQRLIDDPSVLDAATEEFLRHDTPTQGIGRVVRRDTEFHGRQLKKDDRVFLMFAAANRDPAVFDHPDDLDLDRPDNRHMAFALGPHRCIGSNFARLMFKVMITELLARLPDFEVSGDVVRYADAGDVYAVKHLHVRFTPGPRSRS